MAGIERNMHQLIDNLGKYGDGHDFMQILKEYKPMHICMTVPKIPTRASPLCYLLCARYKLTSRKRRETFEDTHGHQIFVPTIQSHTNPATIRQPDSRERVAICVASCGLYAASRLLNGSLMRLNARGAMRWVMIQRRR